MINNTYTNKSLLILLFNANGLRNHVNEIESVLQNQRIDIALITETHFTQYSNVHIPGYKLLKANHPDNTAHGGVAILIKSTIAFQVLPNFCQNFLQSCAVLININNIPVTIAALYSPPKHILTVADFNNYFCTFGNNFIVGGDFNAKHQSWGCRTNNPRGLVLRDFTCIKKLKILAPPGPTYWPTSARKNPDILDIFKNPI
jgi:exonuclease III